MKIIIINLLGLFISTICYGQTISINAQVVDEKIPEEAAHNLETKLRNALVQNGYTDNGYIERFVLTAKVDITDKDIAPTSPARISVKMDITLMVGDVIENRQFASCTLQAAGIGINENKTFINAFRIIKGDNPKIQQMLNDAMTKIVDYYSNQCPEIIRKAEALAVNHSYDNAIFLLSSVPNVCNDCFSKCQNQLESLYKQRIDYEANLLLEKAITIWTIKQNHYGANEVADIICQINPNASNYSKVISLRKTISSKLQADAKREWELKMKQYENDQKYKQSIVDATKAIGIAWAQHHPQTIYKTVIRTWW
jgi:hypothetical protein